MEEATDDFRSKAALDEARLDPTRRPPVVAELPPARGGAPPPGALFAMVVAVELLLPHVPALLRLGVDC